MKKKCTACEKELELNKFCRSKATTDGLSNICKQCVRARRPVDLKRGFAKDREHVRSYWAAKGVTVRFKRGST